MKCNSCNNTVNDGYTFCPFCGLKVEKEKKTCIKCGSFVNEGDNFCDKCGCPTVKLDKEDLSQQIDLVQKQKKCPQCGNTIENEAKFCIMCGCKAVELEDKFLILTTEEKTVKNNKNRKKCAIITLSVIIAIVAIVVIIVKYNSNKLENQILGTWRVDSWWLGTKYEFYEDGVGYYTRPDGGLRTKFTWYINEDDVLTIQFKGESYCREYEYGDTWAFTDLDGDENDMLRIGSNTLYR